MTEGKALILASGGVDSAVCMSLAFRDCDTIAGVSFQYGQKHSKEIEHARRLCKYFGAEHFLVDLPDIFKGSGSALMPGDDVEMPHLTYAEIMEGDGPSPTVVPFRNANLLSAATTVAIVKGFDQLYWGPHATDARHNAYPDCTPEFAGSMAAAIQIGSYGAVRLNVPLQWLTKREVVRLGLKLLTPFGRTWSCYAGGEKQCGECPTCVERIDAFANNHVIDPVGYASEIDWEAAILESVSHA
ncbi:hypothetical protein LCGC14_1966770 [marine sediment metagenome]|uniref:7-cyano-7-deazaguanine synthase n=1 Tax=marine sediment metagenome TaxID=412755 RepID=A0A0F9FCW4_9ZZZZ